MFTGLSSADAQSRLRENGPNLLPEGERPTIWSRLGRELREPMAILLILAAGVSGILLGEVIDAVAILVIVIINSVIALVQEGRAEQALDALQDLEAPAATVMRDGRRAVVAAADLVVDDIVLLQAGDRVPADLALVESSGIRVDEAILTGESMPVAKRIGGQTDHDLPLGDRDGTLHNGTLVSRGAGTGRVTATGIDTALGRIAKQLHDVRREPTPLQRQLTGLSRRLGVAALLVAAGMFALILTVGQDVGVDDAFLGAVALAVAAVPEGLAAVTTVALAMGVARMARRGAIVRRLPAVETLGATDVLVIDKTGTVTENRMHLAACIDPDGGTWSREELPEDLLAAIIPALVLCNDATVEPPTGDPTERALLDLTSPEEVEQRRQAAPRLAVAPFTSDRRMMSSLHDLAGRRLLLVKGAPEVVLPRCERRRDSDGSFPLVDSGQAMLLQIAETRAAQGERLLAIAQRTAGSVGDPVAEEVEDLEVDLTLLALVALRDPPRQSAAASVEEVRAAGVTLLMATGDHPATAAAIAREVGLSTAVVMTGEQIRREGLPEDPTTVDLYARVDPDQKLALVEQLQQQGRTVAMTGDGVNDAPALRRADIGVALGATGSDVAREAADLVITDDDLATIVAAVREGRGIYDNLRKVIDYLVTSNLAEVMVVVGTLLILPAFGVPLFPLQLLWINLLTDGLPALALGVNPVDPTLMRKPPRQASSRLLDLPHLRRLSSRGVVLAASALGVLLLGSRGLGMADVEARTILFSTLVLAQVLYAFVVADAVRPGGHASRWLVLSAVGSTLLQILIIVWPPAQAVFDTATPSVEGWLLIIAGGLTAPLLLAATAAVGRQRP